MQMPPAGPFWSMTLYDSANGFFIPNDRMKYSVGGNAGMQRRPGRFRPGFMPCDGPVRQVFSGWWYLPWPRGFRANNLAAFA